MSELDESKIEQTQEKARSNALVRGIIEQVELFVIVFAIIILAFSFVVRTCRVSGDSMDNTLHHEENVLVSGKFFQHRIIKFIGDKEGAVSCCTGSEERRRAFIRK